MISQRTQLETKVNEKEYIFQCDPTAPLTDLLSALDTFRFYAIGRLKEAEEQQKSNQPEDKVEDGSQ